jgi:dGTPase
VNIRQIIEKNEDQRLAPYAIRCSNSQGRVVGEPEASNRTAFQRDRDRIVYSEAFRRLEYKTQVFPNHEGDHYRTRLTHTIEVSNLSRTLCKGLLLNEDFAECLALVHDIGHPPFGHCGEGILNRVMKPWGGFEHNEQAYRLVTLLETAYPQFPGLNLSIEVNEAILQHTRNYRKRYPDGSKALLETVLVSLADEMVYDAHDIDDGLSSGILKMEDLQKTRLFAWICKRDEYPAEAPWKVRARWTVGKILNAMVTDFGSCSARNLEQATPASPDEAREKAHELLCFTPEMKLMKEELEELLTTGMYRHPKVTKMMNKSSLFMEGLFEHFRNYPEELPRASQARYETEGVERTIADYISGMTDRFLQEEYIRVFMPFQKML